MMSRASMATTLLLTFALALSTRHEASAGPITPENFSITTSFTAPPGGTVTSASGDSSVILLGPATSPSTGNAAVPGTNIVFAQVQLADNGISSSYSDPYSIPYQIDVTLTDTNSGMSGVFHILGTLTGTITDTNGVFSSLFNNVYSTGSQSQTIGGVNYTFTVANSSGFYTNPSPPSGPAGVSSTNGTFSANVVATPVTVTPEPASLALMAIGSLSAGGVLLRRRTK
jgi:hypothetical protein